MRVGKASVAITLTCWLILAMGVSGQDDGFEALLNDIGGQPGATMEPVADPAFGEDDGSLTSAPADEISADLIEAEPDVEVQEETSETPADESADWQMLTDEAVPEEPAAEDAFDSIAAPAEAVDTSVPVEADDGIATEEVSTSDWGVEEELTAEPEASAEPALVIEPPEEVVIEPPAVEQEEPEAGRPITKREARARAIQEEVRRQALEVSGRQSLEAGMQALNANDFALALKHFDDALVNLPDRPANAEAISRAHWGKAEANYRLALEIFRRRGDMKEARQYVERALQSVPDHKSSIALLKRIQKQDEIDSRPLPPSRRPEVVERESTVAELLHEGKQYYKLGDYNAAEALFEKVLLTDQYNVTAMRFLKRIDQIRYKISTKERNATVAGMMKQVRDTWNPPIREEVVLPASIRAGSGMQDKSSTQKLQEKMATIMIPEINFRQGNINDVVNFLVEASRKGDPEGHGVNIVLNLDIPGQSSSAPAPEATPVFSNDFDDFFGGPSVESQPVASPVTGIRTITINLRRISLLDAVKYITEVAGLKFRLEDNVVIITPAGVVSGRVVTRMYPVQPSILDVIIEKDEEASSATTGGFVELGGRSTVRRGDVKDFFEKAGVPFPVGTSITYNQSISQLIVANTPDNLENFERILERLNVIPSQVEIEARFVEVGQNSLEELGLQWILTDNYEIAQRNGSGPIGARERIQVNADPEGLTKGLRFFAFDRSTAAIDPASTVTRGLSQSPLGGLMSIASVLTNPELKVVLHALSQQGHSDLLSAPRVTTRSGANAIIQVVREIIYPTEFEVTQPTVQSQGDLVTPPTVTPGSFQTRSVGVILNVTPTVGPDGYTIDLVMVPEVAELVDWIQYGSEITLAAQTLGSQGQSFRFNIPQPVFSSRNATTSIVIWDGQTVVMGGLIREELVTINDKIPLLGDIPLIGRLFRTEGQKSRKTNLLIFVTARLVDPAGKPIHRAEVMGGDTLVQ